MLHSMYVSEIFARDIGTGPMENGEFFIREPNIFLFILIAAKYSISKAQQLQIESVCIYQSKLKCYF
jgi:hypothetical protein